MATVSSSCNIVYSRPTTTFFATLSFWFECTKYFLQNDLKSIFKKSTVDDNTPAAGSNHHIRTINAGIIVVVLLF